MLLAWFVPSGTTEHERNAMRYLVNMVAALVLAGLAQADIITVCSEGCDHTSINAAIDEASNGDIIQLAAET